MAEQRETCEDCGAVTDQGGCYMVGEPWVDGKPKRHFFLCRKCWDRMVGAAVLAAFR